MKLVAAALTAVAALAASGAAAPSSSTCCRGTPIEDFDPQWSSDGSRIAFIRHEATGINTGPSTLFTMAADGGPVRRLMLVGEDYQPTFSLQRPLLSPDWTKLALLVRGSAPGSLALRIETVDGATATVATGATVTVICAVAVFVSDVAVMVAVPTAFAVTRPLPSTLAML